MDNMKLEKNINIFKNSIDGFVFTRESENYIEHVNKRWNFDAKNNPLLIVYPKNEDDIKNSILFSKINNLILTVRNGGHSIKCNNIDGLLLDLKYLNKVIIDKENNLIIAQGGCLLGDVDRESQLYKLAIPTGQVSETGLSGLSLHGGIGHLTRSYGLTSDNLVEIKLIDYNGNNIVANQNLNSDLFWALKIAGSNFGVIVELKFQGHFLDNMVVGSFWSERDTGIEALYKTCEFLNQETIPRQLSLNISIDNKFISLFAMYNGSNEKGRRIIENYSTYLPKQYLTINTIEDMEYVRLQKIFDHFLPNGFRYYKRGFFIDQNPSKELINIILSEFKQHPFDTASCVFTHLGGALKDFKDDESSFPFRNSKYHVTILSIIPTENDKSTILKWTNNFFKLVEPYSVGFYSNISDANLTLEDYYGKNTNKLIKIKEKYDPINFFKGIKNLS